MSMPVDNDYVALHALCRKHGWPLQLARQDDARLELRVVRQSSLHKVNISEPMVAGQEGVAARTILNRLQGALTTR